MRIHTLSPAEWAKSVGVGVVTALILSAIMVPAFRAGLSPMPRPVGLAFAETVLDRSLPLPVGLLFHVAYVTFWSVAFVAFLRDRLTFANALWLALALWIVALAVFFPILGWGFAGLGVSPRLIVGALIPHLLFAVVLWILCRWAFRPGAVPSRTSTGR